MTRKQRVAAAFGAAAASYESAAEAQTISADRLAARVLAAGLPPAPRVLEVGCGTGLLTRRLLPALGGAWTVTDIAPAMVAAARAALGRMGASTDFRLMDGENPDCAAGSFDLVVSNLAAQWFADLGAAAGRLAACLAPGGRLTFTTLGAGSFAEWRAVHRALGLAAGVPAYPEAAALAAMLAPHGRVQVVAEPVAVRYAHGQAFARALKTIGAGTPAAGYRPLPPGALRRVFKAAGAPLTVTYEVLMVDVERP